MELISFKDMNTAQSVAVMTHLKNIPSTEWLNEQKFVIGDDRKIVLPLCSSEPCCMWCGKDKPEAGWHFLKYPQALCTKECADSFNQAF